MDILLARDYRLTNDITKSCFFCEYNRGKNCIKESETIEINTSCTCNLWTHYLEKNEVK